MWRGAGGGVYFIQRSEKHAKGKREGETHMIHLPCRSASLSAPVLMLNYCFNGFSLFLDIFESNGCILRRLKLHYKSGFTDPQQYAHAAPYPKIILHPITIIQA